MEKFPKKIDNTYDSLKYELIDGSISFGDLKSKLLEKDQSDLSRTASVENLEFLNDPQIIKYIEKNPTAIQGYYSFLNFTEFHVAQNIGSGSEAIKYFESALLHAKKGETDIDWIAYVEGTILYLHDKNIPEEIIEKTSVSGNDRILRNLNSGLRDRGSSSYLEDYSK
jgi:hypothetical protein